MDELEFWQTVQQWEEYQMTKKTYVVYEISEQYRGDKRKAYDENNVDRYWQEWFRTEDWNDIELMKSGQLEAGKDRLGNVEYHEVPKIYKIECHEVIEQVGKCVSPWANKWQKLNEQLA